MSERGSGASAFVADVTTKQEMHRWSIYDDHTGRQRGRCCIVNGAGRGIK